MFNNHTDNKSMIVMSFNYPGRMLDPPENLSSSISLSLSAMNLQCTEPGKFAETGSRSAPDLLCSASIRISQRCALFT